MIVYIDQIFIINLITDFVLLHVSSSFSGRRRFGYTLIAAVIGALYASFMYIPSVSFLYTLPLRLLCFSIMATVAVRPKSLQSLLKAILCFGAVSMLAGGGVFATLIMSGFTLVEIMNNSIPVFDAKTPVILLLFAVVMLICRASLSVVFRSCRIKSKTVRLEIGRGAKKVKLYALVDTGCSLKEPSSKKPVIIVDYRFAAQFVKDCCDVCLIPYSTVDSGGAFVGFYPDYVKIGKRVYRDVAVAVCYSNAMDEKQYSAIINSDILKEESCVA